jgi:hypothetical protein
MANRHTHKKLRAEIRARIKATGESYQLARSRILSRPPSLSGARTDLVPFSYFGLPGTLATFELQGVAVVAFLPSSTLWGRGYPHPYPLPLMRSLSGTRGVQ